MIKERAMELAAALESGEYEQATGRLKKEDGYCCLGVACVLAGEKFGSTGRPGVPYEILRSEPEGYWAVMPPSTMAYFGFRSNLGSGRIVIDAGVYSSLAEANDAGMTFAEIAGAIRNHWEEL